MLTSFLLLASGIAMPSTDIMAQVQAGNLLCTNPDEATKTCSTIASYNIGETGVLVETAEILISPNPPITLEMSSVVRVDGPVNCGTLMLIDMQKGRLRLNGTLLPPDRNEAGMKAVLERLSPMADRKACEELRIESGQLFKYGQIDTIDVKLPGKPVKWIATSEGYKVAPRQ